MPQAANTSSSAVKRNQRTPSAALWTDLGAIQSAVSHRKGRCNTAYMWNWENGIMNLLAKQKESHRRREQVIKGREEDELADTTGLLTL